MSVSLLTKNPPDSDTNFFVNSLQFQQDALLNPLTTTQINALTAATGMMVYNSTLSLLQFYNGASWLSLNAGTTGTTSISVLKGSGTGNYALIGGSGGPSTPVDGTNLSKTITIPTGYKLTVTANYSWGVNATGFMSMYDGGTGGTFLTGQELIGGSTGTFAPGTLQAVITGDGASHTIALHWAAANGSTLVLANASVSNPPTPAFTPTPTMIFRLEVST